MISKKIEAALNGHLLRELEASLQYLAMASWCETKGMDGAASFFYGHAMKKIYTLLSYFNTSMK